MEFDLVDNALHSYSEALSYYHEADEHANADKYKFSILLSCHCAELLLKEVLRREHPVLIFEDIDKSKNHSADAQTVGFRLALQRVRNICGVDFKHYGQALEELGRIRNIIQHYKCSIDGVFYKNILTAAFSSIDYVFIDVLHLRFEDYPDVIDSRDIDFLHEDTAVFNKRKADIQKEFTDGSLEKYSIEYDDEKTFTPPCPKCGSLLLAQEQKIRCKLCGAEYNDHNDLHENDKNCFLVNQALRDLGRRKKVLKYPIYECANCEHETVVFQPQHDYWHCLSCGVNYSGMSYCDECGEPIPSEAGITKIAMSDQDTEDFKYLCPMCAKKAASDESYIGYYIE